MASGGGSATGTATTTSGAGIATVGSWTLGASPGLNTLTATSAGLTGSPVTFTATALALDIAGATIAPIPDQTYTGSGITPALSVTYGVTPLVAGIDYTVGYLNNISVGTATATITGAGSYSGTKSASFNIVKATPTVSAWPTASAITLGQALSASTLSGGAASVPGSFAFTTPATVPGSTGTYSASVTFTPTDAANYASVIGSVDVTVNPAPVVLTVKYQGTTVKTYTMAQLQALTAFNGYAGYRKSGIEHRSRRRDRRQDHRHRGRCPRHRTHLEPGGGGGLWRLHQDLLLRPVGQLHRFHHV